MRSPRAGGFNQALIFYHFGSVRNLLLAVLDLISERRMSEYGPAFEQARTRVRAGGASRATIYRRRPRARIHHGARGDGQRRGHRSPSSGPRSPPGSSRGSRWSSASSSSCSPGSPLQLLASPARPRVRARRAVFRRGHAQPPAARPGARRVAARPRRAPRRRSPTRSCRHNQQEDRHERRHGRRSRDRSVQLLREPHRASVCWSRDAACER